MVFSSPLTDLFIALQLTDIGYRKSMPSNHARERLIEDGLPLTAEVNENLRMQLKCCPEYSNRCRWATWEKWDFRREKDTKCLEEHRCTISSHPRYYACYSSIKAPIASSISHPFYSYLREFRCLLAIPKKRLHLIH
jgi:hypothetical protein